MTSFALRHRVFVMTVGATNPSASNAPGLQLVPLRVTPLMSVVGTSLFDAGPTPCCQTSFPVTSARAPVAPM